MELLSIYNLTKLPKNLLKTIKLEALPKNKRIVVISPHSDDVSISCGGTINVLARYNKITPVLFFTGYRGIESKTAKQATATREEEMRKEAKILGIIPPVFLRLESYNEDNFSVYEEDIVEVENFLIQQNPDIIFLPKKDDAHPRHKLTTQITLKALQTPFLKKEEQAEPTKLFFYENPWSLFESLEFNAVFFLSKSDLNKKIQAVRAHTSQLKRTAFDKATRNVAEFRGITVPEQRVAGYGSDFKLKDKPFAEVFYTT